MKRAALIILFILIVMAMSAVAGEEVSGGRFAPLTAEAQMIAVGKIEELETVGSYQIYRFRVEDPWKGSVENERYSFLFAKGLTHSGNPGEDSVGKRFLIYAKPAPAGMPFTLFSGNHMQPVGGDASVLPLEENESEPLLQVAKQYLQTKKEMTASQLVAHLQSPSGRVRLNAIASLSRMPASKVRPFALSLAQHFPTEENPVLCTASLCLLAKTESPEVVKPLIDFVESQAASREMIPLVAHALNNAGARDGSREIAKRNWKHGSAERGRAKALLARLNHPEAVAAYVSMEKAPGEPFRAFPKAQVGEGNPGLRNLVHGGSHVEKMGAVYSLLRWGSEGDLAYLKKHAENCPEADCRKIIQDFSSKSFLSFQELVAAP